MEKPVSADYADLRRFRFQRMGFKLKPPASSFRPTVYSLQTTDSPRPFQGRAFTLIEMTIVMVIIAILAGLAAWAGSRSIQAGKIRKTKAVMNTLVSAVEVYKQETGYYPGYSSNGYWGIPYDPDDLPASPPVKPSASIPPVNILENPTARADYFQKNNSKPGGSATATPDSAAILYAAKSKTDNTYDSPKRVYSIQAIHYYLSLEPSSKKIISNIEEYCVSTISDQFTKKQLNLLLPDSCSYVKGGAYPTLESQTILDVWNRPMAYGWSQNRNNGVPYLQSSGPDQIWGTDDDVFSYEAD